MPSKPWSASTAARCCVVGNRRGSRSTRIPKASSSALCHCHRASPSHHQPSETVSPMRPCARSTREHSLRAGVGSPASAKPHKTVSNMRSGNANAMASMRLEMPRCVIVSTYHAILYASIAHGMPHCHARSRSTDTPEKQAWQIDSRPMIQMIINRPLPGTWLVPPDVGPR